jgi:DUF1365 family protein
MTDAAAFYVGHVLHRRLRPVRHALKHACYWILLDIDRIAEVASGMKLFSHDRFNILSLRDCDHGDGSSRPLRIQVEEQLVDRGIVPPGGTIRLLCMPRVLGYSFNPLSVFFCHDKADALKAVVYEVHNTFGEWHNYVFQVAGDEKFLRHSCAKDFYVSPFMDMEMRYDFRLVPPKDKLAIGIRTLDREGPMLFAGLAGVRREMNDGSLLRLSLSHPLLTLKVIAAIHIHAAILWWKGVKIRRWSAGLRRARPVEPASSRAFESAGS